MGSESASILRQLPRLQVYLCSFQNLRWPWLLYEVGLQEYPAELSIWSSPISGASRWPDCKAHLLSIAIWVRLNTSEGSKTPVIIFPWGCDAIDHPLFRFGDEPNLIVRIEESSKSFERSWPFLNLFKAIFGLPAKHPQLSMGSLRQSTRGHCERRKEHVCWKAGRNFKTRSGPPTLSINFLSPVQLSLTRTMIPNLWFARRSAQI